MKKYLSEEDLLYTNNKVRKSFQWQLWPYCNNSCSFCFLGETNKVYNPERQLKSLKDLNVAIDNLDFNEYNNVSIIGGEFFQGQLKDKKVYNLFFKTVEKILKLYQDKKIGSIWVTATLTNEGQNDLYNFLDLADKYSVYPVDNYPSSGLWLCTSYDSSGRFHNDNMKNIWSNNILNIQKKYPNIKFNTTAVLQDSFLDEYLCGDFKPKEFMQKYKTTLFYMQPCLVGISEMMMRHENGEKLTEKEFDDFWLELKTNFNKTYNMFPSRQKFIKFLNKYYREDNDTFQRLFNIFFRSDEIHLNLNDVDHDIKVSRAKDGSPEECFPPIMKCGHIYNYAPYSDSNHCCICDKEAMTDI